MTTVAQGATDTVTMTGAQTVSFNLTPGQAAAIEVRRNGAVVFSSAVNTSETVGPFAPWDLVRISAVRGAIDYTLNSVSAPQNPVNANQVTAVAATFGGYKRLQNASYLRIGNSYDARQGSSSTANSMSGFVAAQMGWTETNIAVGGSTINDYANSQFGSRVITAGDNIAGTFGLNDLRYYGPSPTKRAQFIDNFYAALTYLAIPDANKVHAGVNSGGFTDYNPAVIYLPSSASFNGAGTVFKGNTAASRALTVAVNGASIQVNVTGDTVYIWYGQSFGGSGAFLPIIDGVTYGSGSHSTLPLVDHPSTPGTWMLGCLRIAGLPNGPHTVKVQTVSASATVVLAVAGIDSTNFVGANVYASGIAPLSSAGWNVSPGFNGSTQAGTDGKPVDLYELNSQEAWNAAMKRTCEQIKSEGLNVNYVDVGRINMAGANADLVHPADVQHRLFAAAELRVIRNA